uniref:NADH dehydrogenase subunit 4L n=1 Tax=Calophya schini TaxID=121824 RepID=A0A343LDR6_9HEMI|nr:NADH dehydrogenase subunit 4L [Calophya schini]
MFYFGVMLFFKFKKHVLMMLLTLEILVLVSLMLIWNILVMFNYDMIMFVYFLIILVCEAVMGLIVFMFFIRSHGSDYMKISSLFLC